jgi:anti-sigma factor RsiW
MIMKDFYDMEQLSQYADGRLSPLESARLAARITADPELEATFNDLRAARSILKKLPSRKAPHNFTLTRQMVGITPPLPRSYAFFRFTTVFSSLLLIFTLAANALAQIPLGGYTVMGGMGGGGDTAEAPAPEAARELLLSADAAAVEAPTAKESAPAAELQDPPQAETRPEAIISIVWQIGLLALALIGGITMLTLRVSAKRKWK